MKKTAKFMTSLCLIIIFTFALTVTAFAAPAHAPVIQEAPVPDLTDLANSLKNLAGVALLIPALINAGKQFGWVSDGVAPKASLGLNAIALVGMVYLQITGKADMIPALDKSAGALAVAINSILALIFQLYVSRKGHEEVLAGMPVIGTSFSGRNAGEETMNETVDYALNE